MTKAQQEIRKPEEQHRKKTLAEVLAKMSPGRRIRVGYSGSRLWKYMSARVQALIRKYQRERVVKEMPNSMRHTSRQYDKRQRMRNRPGMYGHAWWKNQRPGRGTHPQTKQGGRV